MTQYAAQPMRYPDMPDYRDHPDTIIITGFGYTPATANPDDEPETYRPVSLQWARPDNGIYATMPVAVNGHRGSRVYRVTTPGATGTFGIQVNGVHIPVQFGNVLDAELFAQAIEDANTED